MRLRILFAVFALNVCFAIGFFYEEILFFMVSSLGTGWVFTTIFLRLMAMISCWFGFRYLFSIWTKTRKIKGWIVFAGSMCIGFGISMISPIYQGDYGYVVYGEKSLNIAALTVASQNKFETGKGPQVITFMELGCAHCKRLCYKLGVNVAAGQKIPVTAFFVASEAEISTFLKKYNGEAFTAYPLDKAVFLDNAGFSFPSTFLIDSDGKTLNHWQGDLVNYTALDYLLDLE